MRRWWASGATSAAIGLVESTTTWLMSSVMGAAAMGFSLQKWLTLSGPTRLCEGQRVFRHFTHLASTNCSVCYSRFIRQPSHRPVALAREERGADACGAPISFLFSSPPFAAFMLFHTAVRGILKNERATCENTNARPSMAAYAPARAGISFATSIFLAGRRRRGARHLQLYAHLYILAVA